MKLILSRKGFDSSSGGCPNPIFPDGRLLALPIPDESSIVKYRDLRFEDQSLGTLVHQLSKGKVRGNRGAHLDPDLDAGMYPREPGWRPLLGQHGSAQGHLRNQNVGKGDVFLFFGLFQDVEKINRRWQFVKHARPKHVMWGWMFVDQVLDVDALRDSDKTWLHYHPHLQWPGEANNCLYLSAEKGPSQLPGHGLFTHYRDALCLTADTSSKPSLWHLPEWFFPDDRPPLSYHNKTDRWQRKQGMCELQSAARGQEFVLDMACYPEAQAWIESLINGV